MNVVHEYKLFLRIKKTKKLFFASILFGAFSSAGFAGDTASSSVNVSEGRGCESFTFKPSTISDNGVSLRFTQQVDVCYKSSGEVYRFSTPDARIRSSIRGKALILFAVGSTDSECRGKLTPNNTNYKVSFRVQPGDDFTREVTATGSEQFVKPGKAKACVRIIGIKS